MKATSLRLLDCGKNHNRDNLYLVFITQRLSKSHFFTELLKNFSSGFKFYELNLTSHSLAESEFGLFRDARNVQHCNVRSAEDFKHMTKQEQHCTIKCSTIMALSWLSCCHDRLKPKSFLENYIKSITQPFTSLQTKEIERNTNTTAIMRALKIMPTALIVTRVVFTSCGSVQWLQHKAAIHNDDVTLR